MVPVIHIHFSNGFSCDKPTGYMHHDIDAISEGFNSGLCQSGNICIRCHVSLSDQCSTARLDDFAFGGICPG